MALPKKLQNELQNLENGSEVNKKLRDMIFGEGIYRPMTRMARLIRYRLIRLATNYKAANTNMCCPVCKREEDNYEHMTRCSYGQMDNILNLSELYSEDVQEVRPRRQQRNAWTIDAPNLTADCQDSRKWRRDLRKKEK